MELKLIIAACMLSAFSGMPGTLLPRRSGAGQRIAVTLMVLGCGIGLITAAAALISSATQSLAFAGPLPEWSFHLRLDPLSSFFVMPMFLLGVAGPIYGLEYWKQREHARNGRKLSLCYGLLIAGLALVALAGDGITFLFAWEIMALSAFFLVSTEDHKPEARRAGWIYLIATHIGTLSLFALFAMLRVAAGTLELRRLDASEIGVRFQAAIFLVALVGFGIKAGMMPLHFWLPGAHAAAPSHVSAVLSGVLLKIGIYGLISIAMLLPSIPLACGVLVLILGVISAILGVAFALGQHDLKRLLAYHSIENIGIILIGLGLALVGVAAQHPEWLALGLAGCLLHVWNHSLFKSLLFLAAGSVVHACDTREIDHLGGLARSTPRTATLFALGAIAICGLPPLNGFVSELIIYLGLFGSVTDPHAGFAGLGLAAPALALVGALALACFVKAYGAVFLGEPRTPHASHAHESGARMIAPMLMLAMLCALIGLFPILVLPLLDHVIATWPGFTGPALTRRVPYIAISVLSLSLLAAIVGAGVFIYRQSIQRSRRTGVTWDCGYVQSSARIQYTASSFADSLVGLMRWVLRPHVHAASPSGLFPKTSEFQSHVPEMVLDGWLDPLWARIKSRLAGLRVLQQGRVQGYVLYILLAVIGLLISLAPLMQWARWLLGR
jgi:hydrogenase-4 component B